MRALAFLKTLDADKVLSASALLMVADYCEKYAEYKNPKPEQKSVGVIASSISDFITWAERNKYELRSGYAFHEGTKYFMISTLHIQSKVYHGIIIVQGKKPIKDLEAILSEATLRVKNVQIYEL